MIYDAPIRAVAMGIISGGTAKVVGGSSGIRLRHWVGLFLLILCAAAEWHFIVRVVFSALGVDWEEIASTWTVVDILKTMPAFFVGILFVAMSLSGLLPTLDLVLARTMVGKDRIWRYAGQMLLFGLSVYAYLGARILLRAISQWSEP